MKMHRIITGLAVCGAMLATLAGCEGDYDIDYQRIYFDQAANSSAVKLPVEVGVDTKTTLTLRLVKPQSETVVATLGLDPGLVEEYNSRNGTGYEALPAKYVEFTQKVTLEAGQSTIPVELLIKQFDTPNGENYAIPMRILSVEGPVQPSVASSKLVFLLDKPIMQFVPEMVSASHPVTESKNNDEKNWNQQTNDWSLECWVWMSDFRKNNQAIFNFKASTEIYIRFGDEPIPFNSLQIKYMGTQNNTKTLFTKETWNHIAFTYTGASGDLSVYVNGTKDFSVTTDGGPVTFNGMEMISSAEYFIDRCRMAQVRLWKKALSATELNANMLSTIKPTDENLMGYWKLDEGEGLLFKDCTPNERHMTAAGDVTWIPDTRFDGK